jgi:FkbM family methyltransferase
MSLLPTAASVVEKLPRALRRHRLMTGWMALTGEDPVQLVRIRDNHFGYADMSDGFLRLIVIDKDFEADFFRVADALLGQGGVFLDVGANYGLFSFGLEGRHSGKIDFHLFEPNPKLVGIIERTRALYGRMRLALVQAAVSDKPGEVSFAVVEDQTGISHIDEAGELTVRTLTLDDYLAEQAIPAVGLVKIDIEGYELWALKGAEASLKSRRIQAVYFEFFEKNLVRVGPPLEVLDFLTSTGFVTCFCRAGDIEPRGGATHTIAKGQPGHGLALLPVAGHDLPPATDLLAIPSEHLAPLTAA